ncbi:sulfate transporter-like isoform X2 [Homalodisca vitripennis]|uniref:sulfate transporter-like isoform X2 n=1 Tax=Homalodisca vitripennis TaxID=197043 RepID=UPI001EEAD5EE|nr:sulfate transporter-like isoform X2 [Homalodisca vitripennis]
MDIEPLMNGNVEKGNENSRSLHHPCTQQEFNSAYHYVDVPETGLYRKLQKSAHCNLVSCLVSLVPVLHWLPRYKWKENFLGDVISGFTVAVMHIPQGMAYSSLGGVPPIVGIYMAFFPVLVYFLFGTSRHVSMGTFAVVCMMASKPVLRYSTPSAVLLSNSTSSETFSDSPLPLYTPIQVATVVCLVVGIWQVILGVCRLGSLTVLMSDTLISGFTTGASVLVFTSQIKHVFGIKIPRHAGPLKLIYTYIDLIKMINQTNFLALAMTLSVVTILTVFVQCIKPRLSKKSKFPVPMELIIVVLGTLISRHFQLPEKFNISVVGDIPTGLPKPEVPPLVLVPNVLVDGLVIAIVAFSINISMASIFARKDNYKVDANQELLASCVLAGIIITALKGMLMQVKDLPVAWRHYRRDGVIWIVTFVSVILIDIDVGLGVGIIVSLASIILMGQNPQIHVLGNLPNTDIYLEIDRYHTALQVPKVLVIKISGGMHFANNSFVKSKIDKLLRKELEDVKKPKIKNVVIDMSAVIFIDPSSSQVLLNLANDLEKLQISLCLAKCSVHVHEQLKRSEFFTKFSEDKLFPSVDNAVLYTQGSSLALQDSSNVPL